MNEIRRTGHTRRQFLALGGGTAASALLLGACGGSDAGGGAGGSPQRGGSVTFASPDAVYQHLDVHKTQDPATARFITPMYSKLLEFKTGPNQTGLEVGPDLARDWRTSRDGKRHTFYLRDDVFWHDIPPVNGRKLTSDDVLATFERVINLPADHAWQFEYVSDIKAPDDHTVVITLDKPYAPFLTFLALTWNVIYPREGIEEKYNLREKIIGTGPFMFESWERDEQIVRARHPKYYMKGKPFLDQLNSVVIKEPAATTAALRSGRIAVGRFQAAGQANEVAKADDLAANMTLGYPVTLNLNMTKKPFDDLRVRRAVAMAIDFERLGEDVRGDWALSSTVPPVAGDYALPPDEIKKVRPYDPERSRKLLAEAGYANGFSATMLVEKVSPDDVKGAEYMKQDLKNVGIEVTLQVVDPGTAVERKINGQFEMAKGLRGLVLADAYLRDYIPEARLNYSRINDAKLAKMIEESRRITDHQQRVELIHNIQRYMETDISAAIYGINTYKYHVYQSALRNCHPHQVITGRYWAEAWLEK